MDNNSELVIVNINGGYGHVYDFCTLEDSQAKLNQAQARAIENVEIYKRYIKDYSQQTDYWAECKKKYESAKYEVMTFDEFLRRQKIAFTTGEIVETTEEKFDDMLNVLPPLYWTTISGVEMFCMQEFYTGTYTTQYARVGNKYYTAVDFGAAYTAHVDDLTKAATKLQTLGEVLQVYKYMKGEEN